MLSLVVQTKKQFPYTKKVSKMKSFLNVFCALTVCFSTITVSADERHHGELAVRASESIPVQANANRETTISVLGDGSADIDCFLLDAKNNQVDFDSDSSDNCLIKVPSTNAMYSLRVVNDGNVSAHFYITIYSKYK